MIRRNTSHKKYYLALVLLAALLVAGGVLAYSRMRNGVNDDNSQKTVNLDPPTEEERQAADDQKQQSEEQVKKEQQEPTGGDNEVTPVITSAGQFDDPQYGNRIEVRTFINGVYESGGTCTATFTQGSHKIERQVEAIQGATTTTCDVVAIPRSEFPSAGTWNLVVRYTSPTSSGSSEVTPVEVK